MPRADGTLTTTERGYGASHQRARQRMAVLVARGEALCPRCHRVIVPGVAWDLDHTDDRSAYLGAAHRSCNRRAGQAKGRRRMRARRQLVRLTTSGSF